MQPPLQAGEPADIVVGTEGWRRSHPILKTSRAKLVWFDMKQPDGGKSAGSGAAERDALLGKERNDNWWPGMGRWHLGLCCPEGERSINGSIRCDQKFTVCTDPRSDDLC